MGRGRGEGRAGLKPAPTGDPRVTSQPVGLHNDGSTFRAWILRPWIPDFAGMTVGQRSPVECDDGGDSLLG